MKMQCERAAAKVQNRVVFDRGSRLKSKRIYRKCTGDQSTVPELIVTMGHFMRLMTSNTASAGFVMLPGELKYMVIGSFSLCPCPIIEK